MYCSECGTELPNTAKFCMECGTSTRLGPQLSPFQSTQTTPYIELAETALEARGWKEADEYYTKALEIQPDNAKAWVGKALATMKRQSLTELVEMGVRPERIGPNHLSYTSDPERKVRAAMTYLERALQAESDDLEATLPKAFLSSDPSPFEKLLKASSAKPVAEEALKRLAARILSRALELVSETERSFLRSHSQFKYRIRDQHLLRRALDISVVRGQIDVKKILGWSFPYTLVGDPDGGSYPSYHGDIPNQKLCMYLSSCLEMTWDQVNDEWSYEGDYL